MARWRALPAQLDPLVVQLVSELRRLKDQSGLSLAQFASRTGYSASSWERYLGGRALAPRAAVDAAARATKADTERLLALHRVAAEAWQRDSTEGSARQADAAGAGGTAEAEETETAEAGGPDHEAGAHATGAAPVPVPASDDDGTHEPPEPHRTGRKPGFWRQALIVVVSAAVGAGVTLLAVEPGRAASDSTTAHAAAAVPKPVAYACTYTRKNGSWYAGNSTTSTQQLEVDMTGPAVAELQCLLQRAGITPGGIDGSFGPLTESAVIRAQKQYHLDVDGQVGPRTWAALRG
ncbi:peptidoglycan-binding protein [Streptomyces sp. ICBB 8177]|uniref:peptidoglycan-binding protein n=1 Tax=Streptomyces sp. ICBB 8177 TaxID=563922 RepID=UPI000D67B1BB|nr:peptidoglycan-binding protein [Streptomyces sp. ICBB 8177]PWI44764.1 peptidoglycan-binding protein [Streptomyces sp. ICBB 8177]